MRKFAIAIGLAGAAALFIGCGGSGQNGIGGGYTSGDANGFGSSRSSDGSGNGALGTAATTGGEATPDRIYYAAGGRLTSVKPDGTDPKKYAGLPQGITALALDPTKPGYAFAAGTSGLDKVTYDLYMGTDIDKKGAKKLTETGYAGIGSAQFAPDGKTILFLAQGTDGKSRLFSVALDGKPEKALDSADDFDLDPTGTTVVYTKFDEANGQICVRNLDGSGYKQLTTEAYDHFQPRWSPNGKKIAFSAKAKGFYAIWTMDADGKNAAALTDGSANDYTPVFNPTSTEIAFLRKSSDLARVGIYRIKLDGSGQRSVALSATIDPSIGWSRPIAATPPFTKGKPKATLSFGGSFSRDRLRQP